jgi:hypothetical protein
MRSINIIFLPVTAPQIPATVPEVGPGTYDVDPLGDHTTGMPRFAPGQSHHMVALEKHPDRPSPAFKSPERYAAAAVFSISGFPKN